MDYHHDEGIWSKYSRSKAGNVLHAVEYARRAGSKRIIGMSLNPGNFVTNLQQSMPQLQLAMFKLISHPPNNGVYTELFAGLHPSIMEENNGGWVAPFGKLEPVRKDLLDISLCRKYWEWCETQVTPYM
ncbi:hypothetical protein BDV39DRAFT_208280 [Aspergillus sergii]|uniref:Uncharacterized protein n=1 Tax=Aspergillus sergii TaxID=1034303 RepID=A0A5N6WT92_9EURO|nr:hypothetical protein BDV39DRAFT_208280 [Aspergillus sergii]